MSKRGGAKPGVKRSVARSLPLGVLVFAVVFGAALFGMFLSYGLVATQPRAIQSSQRTIVGKWVNSKGGEINFNADGTGYIPPTAGIEAYSFTYYFEDATHLVMKVAGQAMTVKIELVDDKLTWYTADPNVKYEYTRTR